MAFWLIELNKLKHCFHYCDHASLMHLWIHIALSLFNIIYSNQSTRGQTHEKLSVFIFYQNRNEKENVQRCIQVFKLWGPLLETFGGPLLNFGGPAN